jgi:transcriptional regulator with XRE-family HTH domain
VRKSLTQTGLGVKVELDGRTISRLENGTNAPRDETLHILADSLCSASERADFIALGEAARGEGKTQSKPPARPTDIIRKEQQTLSGLILTAKFTLAASHLVEYRWRQRGLVRHEIRLAVDGVEIYQAVLARDLPLIQHEFAIERTKGLLIVERMGIGIGLEKQQLLVGGVAIFAKPSLPYSADFWHEQTI